MDKKEIAKAFVDGRINEDQFDRLIEGLKQKSKINPRTAMKMTREGVIIGCLVAFGKYFAHDKGELDRHLADCCNVDVSVVWRAKAKLNKLLDRYRCGFRLCADGFIVVFVRKKDITITGHTKKRASKWAKTLTVSRDESIDEMFKFADQYSLKAASRFYD